MIKFLSGLFSFLSALADWWRTEQAEQTGKDLQSGEQAKADLKEMSDAHKIDDSVDRRSAAELDKLRRELNKRP